MDFVVTDIQPALQMNVSVLIPQSSSVRTGTVALPFETCVMVDRTVWMARMSVCARGEYKSFVPTLKPKLSVKLPKRSVMKIEDLQKQ